MQIERSGTLNAFNHLGRLAANVGFKPWQVVPERILESAEERTDFGFQDAFFSEALVRLASSIGREAELNTFGRLAIKQNVQRSAHSRFLVEREIAKNPQILEESIEQPAFVIGMPRTGTSILQALLHRDPNHRSPLSWECLLPCPAPTVKTYRANERIEQIQKEFHQLFTLVPDFKKKHYMEADAPQECIGITANNFTSFQFIAQCYLPSYHDWFVNDADQFNNMRWHKRFLQYLQSGGIRDHRWLLKSPVHMMRLKAIFEVYPDARIITTHRRPENVVASAASLISSVRGLYSDQESIERTAQENLHLWAEYFNRFLKDRKDLNREDQFVDLLFDDFAENQLYEVESIYSRFGWNLDARTRSAMSDFLCAEPKDKHGKHEYSLEDMNLSQADVGRLYSDYLDFLAELSKLAKDRPNHGPQSAPSGAQ